MEKILNMIMIWYFFACEPHVINAFEEIWMVKGLCGFHIYTAKEIDNVLYSEEGYPYLKGLCPLTGHEWNPSSTLNIQPGQHTRKDRKKVNSVNSVGLPSMQVDTRDAMHLWVGNEKVVATHDSGSPLSFHNEDFRNQVDPDLVKYVGRRTIRAKGFFDTEGDPHQGQGRCQDQGQRHQAPQGSRQDHHKSRRRQGQNRQQGQGRC